MPDAEEVPRLRVALSGSAEESKCCASVVTGSICSERGVLKAKGCTGILGFGPVQPAIMRDRDLGMAVRVYVAEINRVVLARGNRRIAAGTDGGAIWHGAYDPGQTIVRGDGNAWTAGAGCVLAIFIGDVSCAVGRNANVSIQAAASSGSHRTVNSVDGGEGVNGDARAKRQAAVVAA